MAETLQFKTELKQLLHLIIHSLYSHKDIFLRELISNASDAIDTARFQSLTNLDLVEGDADWKIKLIPDEAAGTLTIADNGIGMSRATIVENLGTIAKSGTRAFLESLKEAQVQNRPELIGQFGVGFYASFMVAEKVTVISRMAGKPEDGVKWESDGQGEFSIEEVVKARRGTDVVLHLSPRKRNISNRGGCGSSSRNIPISSSTPSSWTRKRKRRPPQNQASRPKRRLSKKRSMCARQSGCGRARR